MAVIKNHAICHKKEFYMANATLSYSILASALLCLSACSGGRTSEEQTNGGNASTGTSTAPATSWTKGIFLPESTFKNFCEKPRGRGFPDKTGTKEHEKHWLRSWSNNTYLWYDEIVDLNPANYEVDTYFELLKTLEQTPSGNAKDKFHFSMPTAEWQQLSQSGASLGYGAEFKLLAATVPRKVVVAYTEPNTPATNNKLTRGVEILEVDGVDLINGNTASDVKVLNEGLFPSEAKSHVFKIKDLGTGNTRTVTMTAQTVVSTPVQNVKTLNTATGTVGYLQFNSHIATAELALRDAIGTLATQNVKDLVIDLRYNGGGLLALASQLGYMVAGKNATANRTFELISFNNKHFMTDPVTGRSIQPMPFLDAGLGFSVPANEALPSLNLSRVFVLTTGSTCSASEAFMNGLRGINLNVIQIGTKTCGKPYGFYPTDNCGETYFSIQFKGVNDKGFGDYADGFQPANSPIVEGESVTGCVVGDDFDHLLGDSNEAMLSAALSYRSQGSCPAIAGNKSFKMPAMITDKEEGLAIRDSRKRTLILHNRLVSPEWPGMVQY
jgi:carboxyl-terminal processing protease